MLCESAADLTSFWISIPIWAGHNRWHHLGVGRFCIGPTVLTTGRQTRADPLHLTRSCAFGRNHRTDSGSGGVSDFRPPPLTPSKAPWPGDAGAGPKEAASQKRPSQNGSAAVHARPAEPASTSGGIEMVEGSYANGAAADRSANPFGFDSFGRSIVGAPQRNRPPLPHNGHQQRPPVNHCPFPCV